MPKYVKVFCFFFSKKKALLQPATAALSRLSLIEQQQPPRIRHAKKR